MRSNDRFMPSASAPVCCLVRAGGDPGKGRKADTRSVGGVSVYGQERKQTFTIVMKITRKTDRSVTYCKQEGQSERKIKNDS